MIVTFRLISLYYILVHGYSYHKRFSFFTRELGNQKNHLKRKPIWHFMPTCHTCSNTLDLPRGNAVLPLPSDNELFELYDLAFKNSYFGVM